ncbi:serpin family protein [Dactylosporangium sp. CA-233914]|uniref:serpin family protein n=1 Tax=Dactylosporangium sp. CA-233914 TaxID=3239934 RepID=UPI003D8B3CA9
MTTSKAIADANALTARWASTLDGQGTVLSGAGVHVLLALLAPFAGGAARDELMGVAPEGFELPESPSTRMATGVWARDTLPLTEAWTAAVPERRRGTLTGDPAKDQPVLDAWAAAQTDGEIAAMPIEVSEDSFMVLASALSVRTTWVERFEEDPASIMRGPWAGQDVALLYRYLDGVEGLRTLRAVDTEAGVITLLTVEGREDVDVVLILGEETRPTSAVLPAAIDAMSDDKPGKDGSALRRDARPDREGDDDWTVTVAPGVTVREHISMFEDTPGLSMDTVRFRVAGSHDLLEHAEIFGLAAATDTSRGHFPGISPEPMAVSQAKQDAVAEFSAAGFKAAAVTASDMVGAGFEEPEQYYRVRYMNVRFDRPFGFAAVHRDTGLVLVAGWVAEPEPYQC